MQLLSLNRQNLYRGKDYEKEILGNGGGLRSQRGLRFRSNGLQ